MWRIMAGFWRYAWRVLVIAVVLFAGYVVVTGVQVWLTSRHSEARTAQAVVVMGAAQYNGVPSPDLAARLTKAQSLWRRHLVPLVVVTGYKEAGDRYTEAQASGTWLVDHGLAAADIVEVGGNDSWANLLDAADALRQRGLDRVLIVTDGFHEDRSLAIASDVGLRAWPVPVTHSPIKGWSVVPYFAKEAFGVAVGRVLGYSRLHDLSSFGVIPVG
jgi:uncharacterized SAM-binding protein YcdF (DUF218 family)